VEGKAKLLACGNYPVVSAEYSADFDLQDQIQLQKECRKYEEMTLHAANRLIWVAERLIQQVRILNDTTIDV